MPEPKQKMSDVMSELEERIKKTPITPPLQKEIRIPKITVPKETVKTLGIFLGTLASISACGVLGYNLLVKPLSGRTIPTQTYQQEIPQAYPPVNTQMMPTLPAPTSLPTITLTQIPTTTPNPTYLYNLCIKPAPWANISHNFIKIGGSVGGNRHLVISYNLTSFSSLDMFTLEVNGPGLSEAIPGLAEGATYFKTGFKIYSLELNTPSEGGTYQIYLDNSDPNQQICLDFYLSDGDWSWSGGL
jgi:hypothetical protein